jgi:hypothetical protein
MSIIELPASRMPQGHVAIREALRTGVAAARPNVRVVKPLDEVSVRGAFCDRCAGPIEFGAVINGLGTYCSVECSYEGPNRPA